MYCVRPRSRRTHTCGVLSIAFSQRGSGGASIRIAPANTQRTRASMEQTGNNSAGLIDMPTPLQPETSPARPTYDATYVWMISLVAALGGCLFGYDSVGL